MTARNFSKATVLILTFFTLSGFSFFNNQKPAAKQSSQTAAKQSSQTAAKQSSQEVKEAPKPVAKAEQTSPAAPDEEKAPEESAGANPASTGLEEARRIQSQLSQIRAIQKQIKAQHINVSIPSAKEVKVPVTPIRDFPQVAIPAVKPVTGPEIPVVRPDLKYSVPETPDLLPKIPAIPAHPAMEQPPQTESEKNPKAEETDSTSDSQKTKKR